MKKFILGIMLNLFFFAAAYADTLPSVADVFGNMSEDEITHQVQMGQQFLADLEKYGTPEEKAEFEKILLDTLNSMSEQDFQDIQNIAKMVEPHLQPEQPATPQVQVPAKEEVVAPKVSAEVSENFKNFIASIIAHIDDIIQKIESCKDCKEEFDYKWSHRATFSVLKREIAQLKNNKLAEKLSKSDIASDDKDLVESLEKFLKELKSNNFVIEDNFGLSDNKNLEQKYLAQTIDIIKMFDNYITILSPKLEKFLTKWDPEALQLAKEASLKETKALQESHDALKRIPSSDARALPQERGLGQRSSKDFDYDNYFNQYGYSPDMSQGSPYATSGQEQFDSSRPTAGTPGTSKPSEAAAKATAPVKKEEIDQKIKGKDQAKTSPFEDVMDSIESHFGNYNDDVANRNIYFLNEVVANKFKALTTDLEDKVQTWGSKDNGEQQHGTKPNTEGVTEWLYNSFIPYTNTVAHSLETEHQKFTGEFDSLKKLTVKVETAAKDLSADEIKKVSDNINRLANRFAAYNNAYQSAVKTVKTSFDKNFALLTDRQNVGDEVQDNSDKPIRVKDVQNKFTIKLKADIGDKIAHAISDIENLKLNIDRKTKRKSKSSKSSSLVMAQA